MTSPLTRRELVKSTGLLAATGLSAASPVPGLQPGSGIYQSIGVRPLINCEGVITIIGGSLTLPRSGGPWMRPPGITFTWTSWPKPSVTAWRN